MPLPIIGLTTSRSTNEAGIPLIATTEAYVQAILGAGGSPLLIPVGLSDSQLIEVYGHLQGLLFIGGGDVDPALYGGIPTSRINDVDPVRDNQELVLVQRAVKDRRPFFGICRGIQVINVALGGKLFTDIGEQHAGAIRHDYFPGFPRNLIVHNIEVMPGSLLADLVRVPLLTVNSLHHQGISVVAPSLRAIGFTPDGLIEAIELPEHPFGLGVQWHPEWLTDQTSMQAIFRGFVEAAGKVIL